MTIKTIKEIHSRLLKDVGGSSGIPDEINDRRDSVDQPERKIESATAAPHSTPQFKDGLGKWEVKSVIRLRSMDEGWLKLLRILIS